MIIEFYTYNLTYSSKYKYLNLYDEIQFKFIDKLDELKNILLYF